MLTSCLHQWQYDKKQYKTKNKIKTTISCLSGKGFDINLQFIKFYLVKLRYVETGCKLEDACPKAEFLDALFHLIVVDGMNIEGASSSSSLSSSSQGMPPCANSLACFRVAAVQRKYVLTFKGKLLRNINYNYTINFRKPNTTNFFYLKQKRVNEGIYETLNMPFT